MRERDDDETEEAGSDLDQIVAMLERSEIDYAQTADDEDDDTSDTILDINDSVRMVFDENGSLIEVNPVLN